MAERLQIWNAALGHVGEGTVIAGLDAPGTPADLIRRHYNIGRDALLASFPWRFARRVVTTTAFSALPPDARYAYVMPAANLAIRKVAQTPDELAPSLDWQFGGHTDVEGNHRALILTQQPAYYVTYTRRIETEANWPALFAEAMAWRLAWDIAFPLTRDINRREECWRQYQYREVTAQAADQRQVHEQTNPAMAIQGRV